MNRRGSETGQALVLTVAFLTVLLGMTALAIDVGTWFHAKRKLQAVADAAALAGAQALPDDTNQAESLAIQYATQNDGTLDAGGISFSSHLAPDDTISVKLSEPAPSFFAKVFGISSVTVGSTAAARTENLGEARYAAPIAVDITHPLLSGPGCPCFGQPTTLDLQKIGPGAFRLINIDGSRGGTGPSTLADWILRGYDGYMPINWYFSDSGAKFNSGQVQSALSARIGDELLFPVYNQTLGQGTNFEYYVVGWVGFHLTGFDARGNSGLLDGWFTSVVWQGIQVSSSGDPYFGARAVQLVN